MIPTSVSSPIIISQGWRALDESISSFRTSTPWTVAPSFFSMLGLVSSMTYLILVKNHAITIQTLGSAVLFRLRRSVLTFLLQIRNTSKAASLFGSFGISCVSPRVGEPGNLVNNQRTPFKSSSEDFPYTLWKINMYPVIINENSLHLKICLLAVLLVLKFYKGILEAITSAFVPNNFTR